VNRAAIPQILSAEDALDYITVGCSAVQVCTLVMNESYHAIEPLVQQLRVAVSKGNAPMMEMKGSAVPITGSVAAPSLAERSAPSSAPSSAEDRPR
jgi:hypothetical protein